MVNNDKLQQLNTFVGGMDLDTADQYLDSKKYREAFNLRVVTDMDGTGGSLTNIEGVRYFQTIVTNLPAGYESPKVIQIDSVRKYGVVLVKAIKTSDKSENYFIFRFINKADLVEGEDGIPKLMFGPCPTSLGDNPSTVIRWEDDDNIKLYYADAINPVRVINVAPKVDATRPMTDDGSFSIYPTSTLTQPEFLSFGSGNLMTGVYQYGYQLFTRNGSETEVSPLTNPIQVASSPLNPASSSLVTGSAKGDRTNKSIRIRIPISDDSYNMIRIVSVFYSSTTDEPLIQVLREMSITDGAMEVSFQDVSNAGISMMTLEEFNMVTSVHFSPKVLETKNNYLFASDIQYRDQVFDVNYDARAYSGLLLNNSLTDTFVILRSAVGDTEYTTNLSDILTGKVVIPANHDCINPFTDLSKAYTSFIPTYTSGMDLTNAKCTYMYDNGFRVWGGKGLNVKWKFVVTELEEVSGQPASTGIYTRYGSPANTDAAARPFEGVWVANVKNDGGFVNKKFNALSSTITIPCNYSNQLIRSNCVSLQRDEVYRYGIVMYDKHRNATAVKWIADIRTPSAYQHGFETFISNSFTSFLASGTGRQSALVTRPLGIEFEVNNLPSEVVSYEIVRVRRTESDRATVTQGVLSNTLDPSKMPAFIEKGPVTKDHRFPTPMIHHNNRVDIPYNYSIQTQLPTYMAAFTAQPYTMTSPEICYNRTTLQSIIPSSGLNVEMLSYLFSATGKTDTTSAYASHNNITNSMWVGSAADVVFINRTVSYTPTGGSATNATVRVPGIQQIQAASSSLDTLDNYSVPAVRIFNLFEQSPTVTKNVNSSTNLPASSTATTGNSGTVGRVIFPSETTWSNYSNYLDFVAGVQSVDGTSSVSYVDWAASTIRMDNDLSGVSNVQGPNGRSIVFYANGLWSSASTVYIDVAASSPTLASTRLFTTYSTSALPEIYTQDASDTHYNNFPESCLGGILCNLRKSIIPYGGNDYQSRQFSTYVSQQAHQLRDTTLQYVFSGDTYIGVMRYIKNHWFSNKDADGNRISMRWRTTMMYQIPCESSINLSLQSGSTTNTYMQKEPSNVDSYFIQTVPMYVYNSVFSVESTVRLFVPETAFDEYNKHVDVRTYYSLKKSNDELVDSWTKFKPLNYLDVDSQYGSINNLRTFGTQLVFWQDNALGVFQVEDRSLIQDDSNTPLLLGTSGVMGRYDYVYTKNGMKEGHHGTDCQSDSTLYFFDYDKHELCAYSQNTVISLGKTHSVQSYIERISSSTSLQSPRPILTYDKRYNEIFATLSATESVIFNERINAFTGFYSLTPVFRVYFDGDVYFVKDNRLYKYNDNMVNNGFDDSALPISLNYLVNTQYQLTKVFDNIEFTGELVKDRISFDFTASYLKANRLPGSNLSMREYNYRGAIPRVVSTDQFANRMRGRVLYCTLRYDQVNFEGTRLITIINEEFMTTIVTEDNLITNRIQPIVGTDGSRFELPYIRTTFRVSKS